MSLVPTVLKTRTDTNNKEFHVMGTFVANDSDHPDGGYIIGGDSIDFSLIVPGTYTTNVYFLAQGFAHNDEFPGAGLFREKRFTVESGLAVSTSIPMPRVLFFDGSAELCQPPALRVHYPADVLAAKFRFYAIFIKP